MLVQSPPSLPAQIVTGTEQNKHLGFQKSCNDFRTTMLPSQEEMFGHILRQMPGSCRFRISSSKHSLFQEPATFDVQSLRADRDIRPVCCQVGLLGNRLSPTPRTIMTESQYNSCAARYIWAFKPPFSGVIDTLQPCEGEGALCAHRSLCKSLPTHPVTKSRNRFAHQLQARCRQEGSQTPSPMLAGGHSDASQNSFSSSTCDELAVINSSRDLELVH